jgi:predicted ATPase/DNA-binding SARP family transcriptional activator
LNAYYHIEMLGDLRVIVGEEAYTRFRTRKSAYLLAYLALHSQQAQPRERLVDLFWGDRDEGAGRDGLSTALVQLRRQLEPPGAAAPGLFLADKQQVHLNPEAVSTDVDAFGRLLAQARQKEDKPEKAALLEQAVELYRGELLPGYYEDWAAGEQTRCALLYQESLLRLALMWEEAGRYTEGLAMAQRACAADPFAEEGYRAQMRLLLRLKKPSVALQLYESMEQLFRRELDARPSASTRQMAETIRQDPRAALLMRVEAATQTHSTLHSTTPADISAAPDVSAPAPPPALAVAALPLQLTRFVGREKEREQIAALIQTPGIRLVSLLGPGGAGKTRLSLEVAAQAASAFANRVWFVPLADIPDASLMISTLVHVLRIQGQAHVDSFERIVAHLGSSPCLLVLDNMEHLLREPPDAGKNDMVGMSGSIAVIRLLLQRVPALVCLVTSRLALRLGGEQIYPLLPLPLPSEADATALARLSANDSIALYVDRARAARPDFALTLQNSAAVTAICRRLEGIPLAIEMAAAWVKTVPPAKMQERLSQQMALLVSRRRDLPLRHQSLRATIEWSYDLLPAEQRQVFACLSVFRGGWSLEAAEAVCGDDTLQALSVLQEHSLIIDEEVEPQHPEEAEPRYRMLEPLREFAWEKLTERHQAEATRNQHLAYYVSLTTTAKPKLQGPDALLWFNRLEVEHANLRAALVWATEAEGGVESGLRIAAIMERFWRVRGYLSEGRAILARMIACSDTSTPSVALANALNAAGILAQFQNDDAAAQIHYQQTKTLWEELGDLHGVASALNNLGMIASHREDWEQARRITEEALTINRRLGNRQSEAINLNNLSLLSSYQCDYTAALTLLEAALHINREIGMREWEAGNLLNMGKNACLQGNEQTARAWLTQGLTLSSKLDFKIQIAETLEAFAELEAQAGQRERAARLWGASEVMREAIGSPMALIEQQRHDQAVALFRQEAGASAITMWWAEGRALSMQQAVELALAT